MAAKVGVSSGEAQENATKHKAVKTVTVHGVAVAESTANAVDNSTYV
jgi:hypothetical protein